MGAHAQQIPNHGGTAAGAPLYRKTMTKTISGKSDSLIVRHDTRKSMRSGVTTERVVATVPERLQLNPSIVVAVVIRRNIGLHDHTGIEAKSMAAGTARDLQAMKSTTTRGMREVRRTLMAAPDASIGPTRTSTAIHRETESETAKIGKSAIVSMTMIELVTKIGIASAARVVKRKTMSATTTTTNIALRAAAVGTAIASVHHVMTSATVTIASIERRRRNDRLTEKKTLSAQ